jgi:hypothetical protein
VDVPSIPNGAVEVQGDLTTGDIDVNDPAICGFLDTFYHLIADPESFGKAHFPNMQTNPGSTEAA